jgi:hypothetical protein
MSQGSVICCRELTCSFASGSSKSRVQHERTQHTATLVPAPFPNDRCKVLLPNLGSTCGLSALCALLERLAVKDLEGLQLVVSSAVHKPLLSSRSTCWRDAPLSQRMSLTKVWRA